jgi:hypothetical protein
MTNHPSYNPDACCRDGGCWAEDTEGEPCWGDSEVIDEQCWGGEDGLEDWSWIHSCQGHIDKYNGFGPYKPPPEEGA